MANKRQVVWGISVCVFTLPLSSSPFLPFSFWVGRDLKSCPVPTLLAGQGCHPLGWVTQSSIQHDLGHFCVQTGIMSLCHWAGLLLFCPSVEHTLDTTNSTADDSLPIVAWPDSSYQPPLQNEHEAVKCLFLPMCTFPEWIYKCHV